MNVVMLRPAAGGEPRFVEVQGTAEGMAFTRGELDELLALAELGLAEIADLQAEMVVGAARRAAPVTRPTRDAQLVCCLGQPGQGGRDRGDPRRRRRPAAAAGRRARRRRGRRHAGGQRPAEGGGASSQATGLAGGRRRHRARGRRARRRARACCIGPLRRASDATYADNRAKLLAALDGCRPDRRGAVPHRRDGRAGPTGASWASRASARARSRRPSGASGGFGYDPRVRAGRRRRPHVRRDDRGREARRCRTAAGRSGRCWPRSAATRLTATSTTKPRWSLPGTSKSSTAVGTTPGVDEGVVEADERRRGPTSVGHERREARGRATRGTSRQAAAQQVGGTAGASSWR